MVAYILVPIKFDINYNTEQIGSLPYADYTCRLVFREQSSGGKFGKMRINIRVQTIKKKQFYIKKSSVIKEFSGHLKRIKENACIMRVVRLLIWGKIECGRELQRIDVLCRTCFVVI